MFKELHPTITCLPTPSGDALAYGNTRDLQSENPVTLDKLSPHSNNSMSVTVTGMKGKYLQLGTYCRRDKG